MVLGYRQYIVLFINKKPKNKPKQRMKNIYDNLYGHYSLSGWGPLWYIGGLGSREGLGLEEEGRLYGGHVALVVERFGA